MTSAAFWDDMIQFLHIFSTPFPVLYFCATNRGDEANRGSVITPTYLTGNIQTDDILTVTATAVRVREDPSDSSKIITNLLQGDKVKFKKTRIGSDGKAMDEKCLSLLMM